MFARIAGILVPLCVAVAGVYAFSNYHSIDAGYVGVKVNRFADKGVQNEVVGAGRYFLSWNEDLYKFPTFNQLKNYEYAFSFQTEDAMEVKAFIGVEYNINPEKAATVFATYRKGIGEITEVNLRQYISDSLIKNATLMDINELTQGGKTKLLEKVQEDIREKLEPIGVHIVKISWMSDLEYPSQVRESINAKIEATQRALLRENEIAQSEAEAQKLIAEAKGEAESKRIRAEADAQAIRIMGKALRENPDVVELKAVERWNGSLPQYMTSGSTMPFVNVK